MQEKHSVVAKSATFFSLGTALSRVGGVIREMLLAFYFGTHATFAAFVMAYRFASILRRVFGEGAVVNGFIPYFEEKRKASEKEGAIFFRDMFYTVLSLVGLSVLITEAVLVAFYFFGGLQKSTNEILLLTMIIMLGLFFICLFGLTSALLQCEKHFFTTGVAPLFFNITLIFAILVLRNQPISVALVYLSWFVVAAYLAQLLMNFPHTIQFMKERLSFGDWFRARVFSQDVKKLLVPLLLGVLGVAAVQINNALDMVFARIASAEGPAFLSYSGRLEQLPLAIFGIAVSSALMPPLARAASSDNHSAYRGLLRYAMSLTTLFLIPATVIMLAFGGTGVNLIFGRGAFTDHSTIHTTICLFGYSIGLVPHGIILLLAPAFYAVKDYKTPTFASIYSVIINILLNFLFVKGFGMGALSVAVATSISCIFNMIYLSQGLANRYHFNPLVDLGRMLMWLIPLSGIVGLVTMWVGQEYFQVATFGFYKGGNLFTFPRDLKTQLFEFIVMMGIFSALFCPLAYFLYSRGEARQKREVESI